MPVSVCRAPRICRRQCADLPTDLPESVCRICRPLVHACTGLSGMQRKGPRMALALGVHESVSPAAHASSFPELH